jgi:gamma-glutamylcyclotransferase (GGCT)/AIG2-like uncharacterized protein YtfP
MLLSDRQGERFLLSLKENFMTTKHFYLAYGMNTDPGAMALRTGTPVAIGRGLVRDHAFRFATHADVFPQPGTNTFGVLWELDDSQLASLDIREGYPRYYDRKKVVVESGGQSYDAWMYYMTPGHIECPPYEGYYQMLTSGYTAFDVPLGQIVDALEAAYQAADRRSVHHFGAKPTRWFNSYTELLYVFVGKKRLAEISREATSQGISTEQLCQDYVDYSVIEVPHHFQVREPEYSAICQ